MSLHPLRNPIQEYDWGSTTALAEFLGAPSPSSKPWAELWIGAHPKAPSEVRWRDGWQPLGELIRAHPAEILGSSIAARYGDTLPFLFKVLAVARPLSIQAHPDQAAARRGFARETARGLAFDAAERSYRDESAKPELLCALTPFRAMCGFRDLAEIRQRVAGLGSPGLSEALGSLAPNGASPEPGEVFAGLLNLPREDRAALAGEAEREAAGKSASDPDYGLLTELARAYPGDIGVLAPLFLNTLELSPGEAIFLAPGQLHAYLSGVGVELMANSDNVLRAGLTRKHMDVDELLAILDPAARRPDVLRPVHAGHGLADYPIPNAAFGLSVLNPGPGRPMEQGPVEGLEILLCTEGEAEVMEPGADEPLPLPRGAAVLVTGSTRRYRIEGDATLYRARCAGEESQECD